MSQISVIHISRLSGKLVGASMRSKDLAKAAGLAVVFDLTAHTFYRLSHVLEECVRSGVGISRGVREHRGDKIGCAHLVRSRGGATKPRNRALTRALYRFSVGAHLQARLHGRQQKNDCDCRHNRFSAWRRGQEVRYNTM